MLGGGPGGLLAAGLLARRHPEWELTVFERLPPTDTFGFGVGLTRGLLAALLAEAPEVHDDLEEASTGFSSAVFRLPGGVAELPHSHAGAISRARLLQILLDRAEQAGVAVRIGESPTAADLRDEADLVIAADGAGSATRESLAAELGATEELGRGRFIWCGAPIGLEGTVFMPVETADGAFVAHAYPYADGHSTFVIETDERSLAAAGCRTDAFDADGDSDEASLAYLSEAFTELLGGERFVGNRSRWMRFPSVHCSSWHHGNVVLLGDAAATAHPSLGSGTKLAMEAAIGLRKAMEGIGDEPPTSRLDAFERTVRPSVDRLQDRARRSQLWWESFPSRLHLSPARIAAAYMSRAGAVSLEQLQSASPSLARRAVADFAGVAPDAAPSNGGLADWVLHRPLAVNGDVMPGRILSAGQGGQRTAVDCSDPWGPGATAVVEKLAAAAGEGHGVITLTGEDTREALLDRLALGERLRAELNRPVAVSSRSDQLDDAVDGLVAGRADLIAIEDA